MDILLIIKFLIIFGLTISIYLIFKNIDVIKIIIKYWKDKLFGE